jgi:beta-galactosidase GanA
MRKTFSFALLFLVVVSLYAQHTAVSHPLEAVPHLEQRGAAKQLIVDGAPFVILGGEVHNSSSSSLEYMKPLWPKLAGMGLNTVVTPLSWELIEPREGQYDFTLTDGLLAQARAAHERVVFLWLASWKNGMSSYAPVWVKRDTKRFRRMVEKGKEVEILSPMSTATEDADARAFAALMRHIKQVDGREHTVLMMQVENEVGVLSDSRDRSAAADQAFADQAPAALTSYLKQHRESLYPSLRELWESNGAKTAGTWSEVFGNTDRADEIFMAWQYARFIQAVTAKGKAAYDIPMYVNTWLAENNAKPGQYPSGCPEPWVVDVWKAAGSSLDFYAPDLYAPEFAEWAQRYHRAGNPLFMPEARGGSVGAANVFYALGQEAGFGFSPFAIEDDTDPKGDLAGSYRELASLEPFLVKHQADGDVHGFVLDAKNPAVDFTMNGYTLHVSRDEIFGHQQASGYGLVMADGPNRFLGAGRGFRVTFSPTGADPRGVGIAAVDEGAFERGKWAPGRRLNGDENDQGGAWRFDGRGLHTERVELYRFE